MKRLMTIIAGLMLVGCFSASAMAATIAYTGFEEVAAASGKYTMTGTPGQPLPTQNGIVTSYAGGNELGFQTYMISGNGPMSGSENGDYIGVSDYYPRTGNNAYELEDVDDSVKLVLETVNLTDYTDVTVSSYIQVKLNSYSNYEASDYINLTVETDAGNVTLFEADGNKLDDMVTNGYAWFNCSGDIADEATWGTFVMTVTTNGSGEGAKLDDVVFDGTYNPSTVPVPGASILLGTGLVALAGLRRKENN